MIKFGCNKISRDNTVARMTAADIITHYKILTGTELNQALKNKLIEEAHEVLTAEDRTELISELADTLEVLEALCQSHNISQAEILEVKHAIKAQRGNFDRGVFMEYIEMAEDNPWVAHFRKSPEKYPEF